MSQAVPVPQNAEGDDLRRWRISPPVLGLTGSTGPEGITILEEMRGEIGAHLFRAFRRTATSSFRVAGETMDSPGETSGGGGNLPIDTDGIPNELRRPLSVLGAGGNPEEDEAGEAASAIGRWASRAGRMRTSAEFYQLAGCVRPFHPACAMGAAQATRAIGDHARAEVWFQRASGLGARQDDWRVYLDAHLGYGAMLAERGDVRAARVWTKRALRRANRQGLRSYKDRARNTLTSLTTVGGCPSLPPRRPPCPSTVQVPVEPAGATASLMSKGQEWMRGILRELGGLSMRRAVLPEFALGEKPRWNAASAPSEFPRHTAS